MEVRRAPRSATSATAYWPYVVLATFVVAVLPLLVVSAIQLTGLLRSTLASIAVAAVLSLVTSTGASALWSRRKGSRDVLFADLMVWGFVRRVRTERRLADAHALLGERARLSPSRQADLLSQLSAALEARDTYTHGHSGRVTRYAEAIARGMGLPREDVARIRTAAAVHDVGKIETPREVLNKPGRLTDEEFAAIKRHPVDGAAMVASMGDDELTAIVRHHHERLDGRGYPDNLDGAAIPLGARIIAVADTFDAITSTRPYRAGARHKAALDVLKKEAGTQLDPAAVHAFLRYYSGRSSAAWWSVVVTEPMRLLSSLTGWLQGAGATPLTKGVLAAGATALVGGAIATPPALEADVRPSNATRTVARHAPAAGAAETTAAVMATPAPAARGEVLKPTRTRRGSRAERRTARRPSATRPRTGVGRQRPVKGEQRMPAGDGPSGGRSDSGGSGGGSGGGPGSGGSGGGSGTSGSDGGGSGSNGSSGGGSSDPGGGSGGSPLPQAPVPAVEVPPLPAVTTPDTSSIPVVDEVTTVVPLPSATPPPVSLPSVDGG